MPDYTNNDKKMNRSLGQAMYRYLPGRWIDFYIKSNRTSYSAFVTNWNSEKISNTNVERIKRIVWDRLKAFEGFTRGFAPLYDSSAWTIMTPKTNDKNSAIVANVSPLMFFCSNPRCRKVTQFHNSHTFLSDPRNSKCKHCKEHASLTQVRMIYYCTCGWAGPVEAPYCSNGCNAPFIQKSTYVQICSKCGKEYEMRKVCPDCGKVLYPRNALDNAQYYVHSLNKIDLVNLQCERFITEDIAGCYLAIAYWLGFISRDKLESTVKNGFYKEDLASEEEQIRQRVEVLKSQMPGLPEDMYITTAKALLSQIDSPSKEIDLAIDKAKQLIKTNNEQFLLNAAVSILEYDTILYAEEIRSMNEAADIAVELNTIHDKSRYINSASNMHFSNVQASGRVPFVTVVYGYTRKNNSVGEENTFIRAFSRENETRSNIYATRMETEGVLFEFDRREIMNWLIKNKYISAAEYSENMDEAELKAWFINNCDSNNIPIYDEIDSETHRAFSAVYKLIHSASHAIIRQAAVLSGLDKNSLSEYIFSSVPAVFIYCQNSQGFNLGAMFSAFEAQFDIWMETMKNETSQCIFDPVCIDETGACAGCLYLNDVSCCHFNHDLDRRLLIGHSDAITGDRIIGFWEE